MELPSSDQDGNELAVSSFNISLAEFAALTLHYEAWDKFLL